MNICNIVLNIKACQKQFNDCLRCEHLKPHSPKYGCSAKCVGHYDSQCIRYTKEVEEQQKLLKNVAQI